MEFEKVVRLRDEASGLDGHLVLHTLKFGPAFGGIRLWRYPDEASCLDDAKRLAEAMTYKCLINDIPGAGGKVVLREDAIRNRAEALKIVARAINDLEGKFYSGTDVGVSRDDIRVLGEYTTFLSCENLSRYAAAGVLQAMRAVRSDLKDARVAIQGLGAVGGELARLLFKEEARLILTDMRRDTCKELARELRAEFVPPDEITSVECEFFSPCALGEILNPQTIPKLRCEVVCGGANNQLSAENDALRLHERGILYVPDFLANSGAAIQGCWSILRGKGDYSDHIHGIQDRLHEILDRAKERGVAPDAAARALVREKLGK